MQKSPDNSSSSLEEQIQNLQKEIVQDTLADGENHIQTLRALYENAVTLADELIQDNLEQAPPPKPLDCGAGCAWCCYSRHIKVTAPEVLVLAAHVQGTFSEARLAEVRRRLAEDVSADGGARAACPLLEDNKCSAYDARPLKCRAHNSMDVTACQRAVEENEREGVPVYAPMPAIFNAFQAGLALGFAEYTGGFEILTLRRALKIALEGDDLTERWLAGAPVFVGAVVT